MSVAVAPPAEAPAPVPITASKVSVVPAVKAEASAESSRLMHFIAIGTFATALGHPMVVGALPMKNLFLNVLPVGPGKMALFFALSGIAWYFKPLFGLALDSMKVFQNRATTLLVSAVVGVVMWGVIGFLPINYWSLLVGFLTLNLFLVIASNVIGGTVVQFARARSATGRANSVAMGARHLGYLVAGPLSGYLAADVLVSGLKTTSLVGGVLIAFLIPAAIMLKKSQVTYAPTTTLASLKSAAASRSFWAAVGLIFLFELAPGFDTPLVYFQTKTLGFSMELLGWLQFASAIAGIIAAIAFSILCRKWPLRRTLTMGIAASAVGSFLFYFYHDSVSALIITVITGFLGTIALLPLLDLAVRATPGGVSCAGFAVIMGVDRLSNHLSDVIGAKLNESFGLSFTNLIWVNGVTTALVLFVIPFLPAYLLAKREGEQSVHS